jgi:cytochrome c oxidase cbb3-type subunit 3
MRAAASRSRWRAPRNAAAAALVSLLVIITAGCDPPGKPEPEPVNKQDITDFAELYGNNCAGCHSADGKSGPARPLNNALYLSIIPKDTLRNTIYYGRPGTAMPAWALSQGGPLTDKQVDALVEGIEKNWSKPTNFAGGGPPSYAATKAGDPVHGKKLFGRACFMCHGPGAPIGPVTDPTYLALVSDQLLRTAILEGWPTLGMPDYRTVSLGHALSDQDITDVVSYLSSMRPIPPNSQTAHTVENGSGQSGELTKGNEGSGHGPGSPQQQKREGNKSQGSGSQGGGIK